MVTGLSSNDSFQQKDTNSFLYHSRNIPLIPACIVPLCMCVCVSDEMKAQNWLAAQRDRTHSWSVCAVLTVSIHASSPERVWMCALTRFRIVFCWVCVLNKGSSRFLHEPVYALSSLLSAQAGWKQKLSIASSSLAFMPGIDESLALASLFSSKTYQLVLLHCWVIHLI